MKLVVSFDLKVFDPARHHILVSLQVALRSADIEPVIIPGNVGAKILSVFEQIGKQLVFERIIFARRDKIQNPRVENINSGVDRIYIYILQLPGARFFEEPDNSVVFSDLDEPVEGRVVDRDQNDGRRRLVLPVLPADGCEIDIG